MSDGYECYLTKFDQSTSVSITGAVSNLKASLSFVQSGQTLRNSGNSRQNKQ